MSVTTRKEYPSLAEIVREETDGGRLIVQFYLGVAYGSIEGFRDNHRAAAARRIDKIAPGLVKEYLQKYHNAQVRESMRGSRFPMGRIEPRQPKQAEPAPRGPNAFQRRLRQHVREETGDGRDIVLFLVDVMEGAITGFKPHHRLEAARELASYVTSSPSPFTEEVWGQDDPSVVPAKAGTHPRSLPADVETQKGGAVRGSQTPSPLTGKGWGQGDSPTATKSATQERANPPVVPAEAGTQKRAEAPKTVRPEALLSTVEGPVEEPALSLPKGQCSAERPPSTGEGTGQGSHSPTRNSKPRTRNFPPISLEELEQANFTPRHINRCRFARDEITGAIYAFDHIGPYIVDDEGRIERISPSLIVGYGRAARRYHHLTRSGRSARTRSRRRNNPNAPTKDLKPQAHPVRPGALLSTDEGPTEGSPGRSPPRIWV